MDLSGDSLFSFIVLFVYFCTNVTLSYCSLKIIPDAYYDQPLPSTLFLYFLTLSFYIWCLGSACRVHVKLLIEFKFIGYLRRIHLFVVLSLFVYEQCLGTLLYPSIKFHYFFHEYAPNCLLDLFLDTVKFLLLWWMGSFKNVF